jgi:hypothetical protein
MHDPSEIRNLPIDIAFSRLQEWLVDRKRVPQDWRKRLAGIRARIAAAFPSLPRDLHPSLLGLEHEGNRIYSARPAAAVSVAIRGIRFIALLNPRPITAAALAQLDSLVSLCLGT